MGYLVLDHRACDPAIQREYGRLKEFDTVHCQHCETRHCQGAWEPLLRGLCYSVGSVSALRWQMRRVGCVKGSFHFWRRFDAARQRQALFTAAGLYREERRCRSIMGIRAPHLRRAPHRIRCSLPMPRGTMPRCDRCGGAASPPPRAGLIRFARPSTAGATPTASPMAGKPQVSSGTPADELLYLRHGSGLTGGDLKSPGTPLGASGVLHG